MGSDGNKRLFGGAGRDRTGDLVNAIHARSQLRYSPTLRVYISNPYRNQMCGVFLSRDVESVSMESEVERWYSLETEKDQLV